MARKLNYLIVKKLGNWDEASKFFSKLGYRVKTVTLETQEKICKDLKSRIIKHLLAQDLNWEQLSEKTKERKSQKHRDDILIDTELYLKSITTYKVGMTWYVGVKKGIAYRRKGSFITLDRVAYLNELGTTRIPARPLWIPTFNEVGGFKGIQKTVLEAIYDKLEAQSKGGPVKVSKKQILSKL